MRCLCREVSSKTPHFSVESTSRASKNRAPIKPHTLLLQEFLILDSAQKQKFLTCGGASIF